MQHLPAAIVITVFAAVLLPFVAVDQIFTLSSDADVYLLMAQVFSPTIDTSPGVYATLNERALPPGFPLLLAATGLAGSFLAEAPTIRSDTSIGRQSTYRSER